MDRHVFHDRGSAGALLGVEVAKLTLEDPIVLGLPRGGVPVAAMVAKAIGAPLDVIVVRKLGVPDQPELAMGAIGENDIVIVNKAIIHATRVTDEELAEVQRRERATLDRTLSSLRPSRPNQPLAERSAVIVDDGIATGATVRAAIGVVRAQGVKQVVVATPVAPVEVVEILADDADIVVCLARPNPFGSVGRWYRNFEAVSDTDVVDSLVEANTTGAS
jgi:putative phosphoribosyl transferase